MKYRKFCSIYSVDRATRYFIAANCNQKRAIFLYYQNQKLAKAFHPLLGMYEVVLRNRLNDLLTSYFGDSDWILNQRSGFMHDHSIKHRKHRQDHYYLKELVDAEIARLNSKGEQITASKIISELNFGFWTMFFEPSHSALLGDLPLTVFSGNKDCSWTITKYYDMVQDIRHFRNRVSHNESLIFKGNSVNLTKAKKIYKLIVDSLNWIDPAIFTDCEHHTLNTVPEVIDSFDSNGNNSIFNRLLKTLSRVMHS